MKRGRTPDCLGDLRFDQWRAGELGEEDEQKLKQHLSACERCRERQALHDQARERYQATVSAAPAWLEQAPEPKRRGRPWSRTLVTLCVAAGAIAVLQLRFPQALQLPRMSGWIGRSEAHRLPFISFYVRDPREQVMQRGMHGQTLQRGQSIHVVYSAGALQYLAILSLDSTDGPAYASVEYPRAATDAVRIEPGSDVPLPSAVTLEESPGETSIVAIFCEQPFELDPMREALELQWSSLPAPPGCSLQEITVTRR